jgi:hypothetical protein
MGEAAWPAKAECIRHRRHGHVGVAQQWLCGFDAAMNDELMGRQSRRLFEVVCESMWTQARDCRERL